MVRFGLRLPLIVSLLLLCAFGIGDGLVQASPSGHAPHGHRDHRWRDGAGCRSTADRSPDTGLESQLHREGRTRQATLL